ALILRTCSGSTRTLCRAADGMQTVCPRHGLCELAGWSNPTALSRRVAMDVATAQQRRSGQRRADVRRSSIRDLILWLGEPACHERARVGGKAATLSRLAAAYRVPPGFCLTTASYALAQAGGLTREEEGSRLPALPVALYAALATAYRRLADRADSETQAVA